MPGGAFSVKMLTRLLIESGEIIAHKSLNRHLHEMYFVAEMIG